MARSSSSHLGEHDDIAVAVGVSDDVIDSNPWIPGVAPDPDRFVVLPFDDGGPPEDLLFVDDIGVYLKRATGGGTWGPASPLVGSGANASALRIADLDCDGALDLATTVVVGGRRDAVLLRRSGLTFEAPVLLGFSDARDVLVADPLCALGQPVLFVALADVPTVIVLLPVLDRG